MHFMPGTQFLKFPRSLEALEATLWLYRVNDKQPYGELRQVFPTNVLPNAQPPAAGTAIRLLPRGPVVPVGRCPQTGRALRLFMFRDLSCVLYRDGPEGGAAFEALPAALVLPADVWSSSVKEVDYIERGTTVPRIWMQVRDNALRWRIELAEMSDAEFEALVVGSMEAAAAKILEAPAVADPRMHDMIPEGGRFTAYSRFPHQELPQEIAVRIEGVTRALACLRSEKTGHGFDHIYLARTQVSDPWRNPTKPDTVFVLSDDRSQGQKTDKKLSRALRTMLRENMLGLPDAQRLSAGSNDELMKISDIAATTSHHQLLSAHSRVQSDPHFARLKDILDA